MCRSQIMKLVYLRSSCKENQCLGVKLDVNIRRISQFTKNYVQENRRLHTPAPLPVYSKG